MTDMTQVFNSMENTLRLQNRARAERRARKALQVSAPGDRMLLIVGIIFERSAEDGRSSEEEK